MFVANRVRNIAVVTGDLKITLKYSPSNMNLVDSGRRGASMVKMVRGNPFTGPDLVLDKKQWLQPPDLKFIKVADKECKPKAETNFNTEERKPDEWAALLEKKTH